MKGRAAALLLALATSCASVSVSPDPARIDEQIAAGLAAAGKARPAPAPEPSLYTSAGAAVPEPLPIVTIVVPREIADAAPRELPNRSARAQVGKVVVVLNPTRIVVQTMAAYFAGRASVEVVPDPASASPASALVLEPVVDEAMWNSGAHRINVRIDLTLRDHSSGTTGRHRPGWISGGDVPPVVKATANADRVVLGMALATALALDEADVLGRLPNSAAATGRSR